MSDFTYPVSDERYRVPTLAFRPAANVASARSQALEDLRATPRHSCIEVRHGDILLFTVGRGDLSQRLGATEEPK